MAQFKEGQTVRIKDTPRIRQLNAYLIGTTLILTQSMAEDLNAGFPAEDNKGRKDYDYWPAELETVYVSNSPATTTYEDPDVAEARRMAGGGGGVGKTAYNALGGSDSDLDRMEREMDQNQGQNHGYRYPEPAVGSSTSPQVKAMREELKSGVTHGSGAYEHRNVLDEDRGINPILIVRAKTKRRELIVGQLPQVVQMPVRR